MQGTKTVNMNLCIGVVVKGRRRSSRDDVATGRDTASNGVEFVAIRPVSQYVVSPMKNPPGGGGVQTAYISETTVHLRFYRAMHFSAKRGIAIACRLSVRPSVCLSVCL